MLFPLLFCSQKSLKSTQHPKKWVVRHKNRPTPPYGSKVTFIFTFVFVQFHTFSGFELEPGIPGNSNFGFVVSMLSKSREIERPSTYYPLPTTSSATTRPFELDNSVFCGQKVLQKKPNRIVYVPFSLGRSCVLCLRAGRVWLSQNNGLISRP